MVVPGRMEPVAAGQPFTVLVDYAHTPGALERLVEESRRIAAGHRVVLVFGCGGDRDPSKRAGMGEAAAGADEVVLTSDNPRSRGSGGHRRRGRGRPPVTATRPTRSSWTAGSRSGPRSAAARAGDVVVIAGKGHETGQDQGGIVTPFDDRVVAREELEAVAWT